MNFKDHIEDLLSPAAYETNPTDVEFRQTHISYLFLTPDFVYKVKKPVNFGFLDFTTLEKRRHFCEEEIRLNRRLAPDVYIGLVEIREKSGRLTMAGGVGDIIEYAVKMRRLAADTILEESIRQDTATVADITRVAERIAEFHKNAERGSHISDFGAPEIIEKNITENFTQIEGFTDELLSAASLEAMRDEAAGFVAKNKAVLLQRIKKGFIRDCHGDIHSEHISINKDIEIIDCIEFNERFRYSDTISDMAFLSMDLDFHNRSDLGRAFEKAYLEKTGDYAESELINFYKAYRAAIRGKVEGLKAGETEVAEVDREEARVKAIRYFDLALGYTAASRPRPRLIIICGVSGTGKSTIAAALGRALWATPLATDRIRQELLAPTKSAEPVPYAEGVYSAKERARTYQELNRRALAHYLKKGRTVILDGTFSKQVFLDEALKTGSKAGLAPEDIFIFECRLEAAALNERIGRREARGAAPGMPLSEMRSDIFKAHVNEYEKKKGDIVTIDGGAPVQENILRIIKIMLRR